MEKLVLFIWSVLIHGGSFKGLLHPRRDSYGFDSFEDVEGPDCLRRVTEYPSFTLDTSFTPQQEREVLLNIYARANGRGWFMSSGWNDSTMSAHHCSWYGVTCHTNTSYVKTLSLPYNNLNGSLPSNIWKIRNLFSLCVPGNPGLHGNIQDLLYGNMSNLLTVILFGSSLTGNIPDDFVKMTHLQNFIGGIMKGTGFSGHLPDDIGNMTELRLLSIPGNNFTGKIPTSISRLKRLDHLNLRNNPGMMQGNLDDLFAISSLEFLYVSGVHLSGKLPHVFPENLVQIFLPGNSISGELPRGTKPPLLNLANNQLTGDIPGHWLVSGTNTSLLDLSQNKFSSINEGKPWPDNSTAAAFSYLSFAENRNLSINFTSFMGLFKQTKFYHPGPLIFNISLCDITSPLVGNLFSMQELTICDLHSNNFYGPIPAFTEDTSLLSYLDLSWNNFTGAPPSAFQDLISLQYFDISGNPLMRNEHDTFLFFPDFLRMTKPPHGDNFTCAEGRLTFNNGRIRLDPTFYEYKYCICDHGYYGDKGLCHKCMEGGICNTPTISSPEELKANTMKILKGYWPSPDPKNVTHLVECPVMAACNPTGSCTCHLNTAPHNDKEFEHCGNPGSVSSLITTCNDSCICYPGNSDRFCSRCEQGFYKLGGLCFQCKHGDLIYYYILIPIFSLSFLILLWSFFYLDIRPVKWFAITVLHFSLMLIMMLLEFLPAWLLKLNLVVFVLSMTSRGKNAQSLISIAVFYIQTTDFMVSSVNVWPPKVIAAQSYLSSYWNLVFPSLSCDLPSLFTPVGKLSFLLLLPIVCLTLVGVYFIVMLIYDKHRPIEGRMENIHFKCRQSAFFTLNFSYFPIVQQTLSNLRPCHNDQGVFYMPDEPWIECTSYTYYKLRALGIVSVIFYVIGFPLIVIFLMVRFFPKRKLMTPEDRKKLDVWLGPLYLPYKPKYQQFFEILMLVHRLILAVALSMISSSTLQTFIVWLVLMTSALIQICLQPYQKHPSSPGPSTSNEQMQCKITLQDIFSENLMEPTVLLVLSMSFMVLRFSVLDKSYIGVFVWLVMIINSAVFVTLIGGILYHLVGPKSGRHMNEYTNMDHIESTYSSSDINEIDREDAEDGETRPLLPAEVEAGYHLHVNP
ncbi:PREDICTED: putative leucine-rich repeat-containing protein DDB_G0281931 [Acropora digitifera]|uniref:putative leucine-rich repeat-containing protein DDB_G0281931 n=1 Tax=Acropora digitifera TaxID=70779 RepID=UPI00077A65A2|nr:PREDICTED: putative leucine-rich repeat-containing protein DDB_G0281931 [Acropora digitifera]